MVGARAEEPGAGHSIRAIFCVLAACLLGAATLPGQASAEFSGANGMIAYAKHGAIWTMAPDGSHEDRIARSADEPALSRNGRLVTFVRGADIWVSTVSGKRAAQLTDTPDSADSSPSFSPNNRTIVYEGPPAGGPCCIDIWAYNATAGNFPITADGYVDVSPAVSPDGDHLVWIRNGDIYTMTSQGTNFKRVKSHAYTPQYSPSGHRIIYGASGGIYSIKPNGKGRERLIDSHRFIDVSPVYSPDGKYILFDRALRRGMHGDPGIYIAKADGSDLHLLVRGGKSPSWAPR
jgi:Tol biopolymer transport system component